MVNQLIVFWFSGMGFLPEFFTNWGGPAVGTLLVLFWLITILVYWFNNQNGIILYFRKPKNRLLTLLILAPALLFFALTIHYHILWDPHGRSETHSYGDESRFGNSGYKLAQLFIANHSPALGKVVIRDKDYWFPPHSSYFIVVYSNNKSEKMRAWLGDLLVLDTVVQEGRYIGSLSRDAYVFAQQMAYVPEGEKKPKLDSLPTFVVGGPGIERFDTEFMMEAFGFDTEPPYREEKRFAGNVWDIYILNEYDMKEKLGLWDEEE